MLGRTGFKKMRLLIVEDDAALARGILKVFRAEGLAVDHATNGQDALAMVQMEPYSASSWTWDWRTWMDSRSCGIYARRI